MTTKWSPIAYVGLRDGTNRRRISEALRTEGWTVVGVPSGYHLVESIADGLLGDHAWRRPNLVVADAISPGFSGITIAQGLRDLGWSATVVLLVDSPREKELVGVSPDDRLHLLDARDPAGVLSHRVVDIARTHRDRCREIGQPHGFPIGRVSTTTSESQLSN